jgi:hypothetical protein
MTTPRSLLLSFLAVSFAMLTGCGAATPKASAPAMDASWLPSEAMDLTVHEDGKAASRATDVSGHGKSGSYRPNRESIPQHGAVHAAID